MCIMCIYIYREREMYIYIYIYILMRGGLADTRFKENRGMTRTAA